MKESYEQGLASHLDPESYAGGGDATGVAMTGAHAGQVLSSEISTFRVPTLSDCREGHTRCNVRASHSVTRRSQRPCTCVETPGARTGRSCWLPLVGDMDPLSGTVIERRRRYC